MYFNDRKSMIKYLKQNAKEVGFGSQGVTYYDSLNEKAIKVYHQFFDNDIYAPDWTKEEILKFNSFTNDTYLFPENIVSVKDTIYGYTSKFVKGKTLDTINPFIVNINNFIEAVTKAEQDVNKISREHIVSYDVLYNTMYGNKQVHVIDTDEYSFSLKSEEEISLMNTYNFNMAIMYFLVDSYFEELVNSNNDLRDMYRAKYCDIKEFLNIFKNIISENIGTELINMSQAKPCLNKVKRKEKFIRTI